ncbi:MAG: NYN domain-containing protein [Solirubrobacterales bacterium]|nr:NYN domain-containing protein [Solirubrobacterales bacterium]
MPSMGRLVVDGMNVIGSRPDGWWRDRDAAARRLHGRLEAWARRHGLDVLLVLDGAGTAGWHLEGLVEVVFARDAGFRTADDAIVALVERELEPAAVEVVTSDRELTRRVRTLGATVSGPRALLEALDGAERG